MSNVTISLQNLLNKIRDLKQPLVNERNSILENVFKYHNPIHKKKLKVIDSKLDMLDALGYWACNQEWKIK